MSIQYQQQARMRQSNHLVYTYHLPYGIRREICNLLNADQSWRTLGGQFIGIDETQLTLIGQAYMRNSSPTDELLNKLDSANVRISEFCSYLKQMNHCRALEILKPYMMIEAGNQFAVIDRSEMEMICSSTSSSSLATNNNNKNFGTTLDTPTPSFADQSPAAILMGTSSSLSFNEVLQQQQQQPEWFLPEQFTSTSNTINGNVTNELLLGLKSNQRYQQQQQISPPTNCHKQQLAININAAQNQQPSNQQHQQQQQQQNNNHHFQQPQQQKISDPGEEIVKMACASNKKRTSISDQEVVNQLRLIMQITYNELKLASENFSDLNILGNGGFASVYRGHWKGTDVAIKRLKCNLMDQALNELTILNSYRIDNILPIYGISIDGPEACLVYQFMANGSLEDRLSCKKGTAPLTWNQRALICEGVAKGLYYLHTLRDKPLVHGDVKSANVLLDSQFVPKLGDFGLARQVLKGKSTQTELCTHCTVSSIHGTSVYLPPEYLRHKILSPAVDVYSYGIVLLEMATGRRAYDGKRLLIDLVEDETRSMSQGQIGYSLKDSRLSDDTQSDLKIWYELLIKLGLNCAHKIKKKRLDMGQVLNRFADFKNSNLDLNLNLSGIGTTTSFIASSYAGSATTARTLTPDLATLDRNINQLAQQAQAGVKPPVPGANSLKSMRPAAFNSALMSVEEEEGILDYADAINVENNENELVAATNQVNYKEDFGGQAVAAERPQYEGAASVEAMIPLLTELGVVPKQQQQQQQNE